MVVGLHCPHDLEPRLKGEKKFGFITLSGMSLWEYSGIITRCSQHCRIVSHFMFNASSKDTVTDEEDDVNLHHSHKPLQAETEHVQLLQLPPHPENTPSHTPVSSRSVMASSDTLSNKDRLNRQQEHLSFKFSTNRWSTGFCWKLKLILKKNKKPFSHSDAVLCVWRSNSARIKW